MEKSPDAFRTISEVSELLDTPAHVLRFWESRFTQVRPVKRAGGRRYYRPTDIALLAGIKRLLHEDGLTIRGAQKILREQGVRFVASLAEGLPSGDSGDEVAQREASHAVSAADTADEAPMLLDAEDEPTPVNAQVLHLPTSRRSDPEPTVDTDEHEDASWPPSPSPDVAEVTRDTLFAPDPDDAAPADDADPDDALLLTDGIDSADAAEAADDDDTADSAVDLFSSSRRAAAQPEPTAGESQARALAAEWAETVRLAREADERAAAADAEDRQPTLASLIRARSARGGADATALRDLHDRLANLRERMAEAQHSDGR